MKVVIVVKDKTGNSRDKYCQVREGGWELGKEVA